MSEPWSEIDAWRSIWEAIAIVNGDDPDVAADGHRRLCRSMGWEMESAVSKETKACTKCGEEKLRSEFYRHKKTRDGLRQQCKSCMLEYFHRPENKERVRDHRQNPDVRRGLRENERVRSSSQRRKEYLKEYFQRPDVKERMREHARKRRETVRGCIYNRISRDINNTLRYGKSRVSSFDIIGYSAEDLARHLEKQFTKGMTWARFVNGEIHIDHIVPVSSFTITSADDPELRACWALSNLRPMWALDNKRKSCKRLFLL